MVQRILEQWNALQLYFNAKWLDERLGCAEQIHVALTDPFNKIYFLFLNYILPKVTNLNEYFQSDKVLVLNLHKIMIESYQEFLCCYMERKHVLNTDLDKIDPQNETWFLPKNKVYVGVDAVRELSKPEIANRPHLVNIFYERCQQFYSILCSEFRKRYNFSDPIMSKLHIFSPKNALSHKIRETYPTLSEILIQMPRFLKKFDEHTKSEMEIEPQLVDDEWRLLPSYSFDPDEYETIILCNNDNVDVFWGKIYACKNTIGLRVFENLSRFVLNILCLPHSNASCERVFSKVNLIKTKARNKLIVPTINGCLLASQCVKIDGNCIKFKPTKNMISGMTKNLLYPSTSAGTQLEENEIDDYVTFE